MGQISSCNCFEGALPSGLGDDEVQARKSRLAVLQKGDKFLRSAWGGLSSTELFMDLSDDASLLRWKTVNTGILSKEEHGQIDLTSEVKSVRMKGSQGMCFISENDKTIFEVQAEESKTRDAWVLAINDLLDSWEKDPESKPSSTASAAGTSNKQEYFRKREEEIKARQKQNEEKKKKYSAGGMKFVAQAMLSRD